MALKSAIESAADTASDIRDIPNGTTSREAIEYTFDALERLEDAKAGLRIAEKDLLNSVSQEHGFPPKVIKATFKMMQDTDNAREYFEHIARLTNTIGARILPENGGEE